MICSSDCAELWAVATIWRCCVVSSVRASTSSMPVTPIIGVRISWLIAARKVDFARLACSAAWRAASASCSARSRAAMSDSNGVGHLVERARDVLELGDARIVRALGVVAARDPARRDDQLAKRAERDRESTTIAATAEDHDQREDRDLRGESCGCRPARPRPRSACARSTSAMKRPMAAMITPFSAR